MLKITRTLDLNTAIAGVEYDNGDTHYTRENFYELSGQCTCDTTDAEGGDKLNLDVKWSRIIKTNGEATKPTATVL